MSATEIRGSVFPEFTLDRSRLHWEDFLDVLTPIEERGTLRYKREDYFAPLGYGGINGAKLRQLIFLIHSYVESGGDAGVLTGASVLSPQLSMSALVARHFELPTTLVLGATKPESAIRHENVAIAAAAGAEFIFTPVGFNPALQRAVRELHAHPSFAARYRLCYGITTPEEAGDAAIEAFHRVGARQVDNVPADVHTIVLPAGSCNSCTSVLYGLARNPPAGLRRVVLFGIGPTRLQWIEDRLDAISRVTGLAVGSWYRRLYHDHPALQEDVQSDTGEVLLEHFDLHSTGFASYQDRMPWARDGIDFHPTYEGKLFAYMAQQPQQFEWLDAGGVLFWIVGSAPSRAAMSDAFLLDGITA